MKQITEEQIGDLAHEYVFNENGHKWSNNDNTAGDNFGSFIAGFKAAQQQLKSEWIPVSDRLPETSGWYLVALPAVQTSFFFVEPDHAGRNNEFTDNGVTHWQPLPDGPEQ